MKDPFVKIDAAGFYGDGQSTDGGGHAGFLVFGEGEVYFVLEGFVEGENLLAGKFGISDPLDFEMFSGDDASDDRQVWGTGS